MLTFSSKNHTTQHTQQTALTGRQNVHASTQLDKCNNPYQLIDKHNKPHYLAEEMFQTSTQLDKQALLKNRSTILTYYKTVRTPPREPTRQTRLTGKA